MERTEPTFVPEWLKSSGSLSTTSHQFTSSSLHSDEQGVSKAARNKSLYNIGDNDLGRASVSDRTTSTYFRRNSGSNGLGHLRSYSSFGRNNRDKDWDKDGFEFRNKDRHRDYSDPLGNILPSRFEKDGLRRTHSSLSGKRGDSWPRKVVSENVNKSSHTNGGTSISGGGSVGGSGIKTAFERDFPSLGADDKQGDTDIGRVPSPGLSSAIQSLPIGNSAVLGGDGWTSALAEVPVIVGSNGGAGAAPPPTISAATSGRNMAETLAHGSPRAQTAPQLTVGTQRLEELAVKQSRQLIPVTPSMPKALVLNSSDKPKLKVGQSQVQGSHLTNHPHTPRPLSVKPDVSKTSTVGKLLVLKPSRERNGLSPTAKESLSPTGGGKLPNSPLAAPPAVERKAIVEKRPSSQAQSRNNFFNLMRKKSMTSNSSVAPDTGSSDSTTEKPGEPQAAPPASQCEAGAVVANRSDCVHQSSETKVDASCNGDACVAVVRSSANNGKNHSGPDAILSSEEEEARFLRSLGWDETAEEEEGLTEEEISSFYRNYVNLKPELKYLKGTQPKLMMDVSSGSKLES